MHCSCHKIKISFFFLYNREDSSTYKFSSSTFSSRPSNIICTEGGSVSAAVALAATASCRWNVKNSFGYILNLRADSALHGAPGEDP